MLEVKSLERQSGNQILLADISVVIKRGEAVAVLGPSGAGKTLFLRSVAFVDTPTRGSIRFEHREWIFGKRTTRLPPPWPEIVLMFQSGATVGHASLLDNMVFAYRQRPNWEQKRTIAQEMAERFALANVLNQRASLCSVGQRQRTAFIRTIVSDAKLILLDEPTAALDPAQTENVGDAVLEHKRTGRSFFISTHMLGLAKKVCDRFIYIQDGKILARGAIEALDNPMHPDLRRFVQLSSLR